MTFTGAFPHPKAASRHLPISALNMWIASVMETIFDEGKTLKIPESVKNKSKILRESLGCNCNGAVKSVCSFSQDRTVNDAVIYSGKFRW